MEMANYGFDDVQSNKIMGGTQNMEGDSVFISFNPNLIIEELTRLPNISTHDAIQIWDEAVQWGTEPGAIRVSASPLGSLRLMTRRLGKDLHGDDVWWCKDVLPINDNRDQHQEINMAHKLHKKLEEIAQEPLEKPEGEFEDMERLSWKLWHITKKKHPSYIMFPVSLRRQDENYYKLVYEFRGAGTGSPYNGKTGRAEQFNIDMIFYPKRGVIRSMGYDIDSSMRERKFYLQPSEWDECFSPKEDEDKIVENIVKLFLQY